MKLNILFLLALGFLASGCGDAIPQAYRGDFVEATTGATLQLDMDSGVYKDASGRMVEGKSYKMIFKDLKEGKPGVYFKDNPNKKNVLELYWLNPDLNTRQEAGGIEYFQTEVFYFRLDRQAQSRVDTLQTVHSLEGIVSLDGPTQQFQVGWPAQSETLNFRRVSR